jgi:type IV pilus assembly protein PilC
MLSALNYPAIVLCASVGAVAFMLHFIVPMFADVFKRFGGKLPFITQLILDISQTFTKYMYLGILLITALGFLMARERKKPGSKKGALRCY